MVTRDVDPDFEHPAGDRTVVNNPENYASDVVANAAARIDLRARRRQNSAEELVLAPEIVGASVGETGENIRVQPVYTERMEVTTTNDNRTHKTLCGQTLVEPIGEDEWRVTIEGQLTEPQLNDLIKMRPANNEVAIIANPRGENAKKYRDVKFDRFTYEYTDEANTVETDDGIVHPIVRFQLQTEDDG